MEKKNFAHIGIYGLGPMGISLGRNLARKGYAVCIANRTESKARNLYKRIKDFPETKNIIVAQDLRELVKLVPKGPIFLLISSGDPQEDLIGGESSNPIDEVIFKGSQSLLNDGKSKQIPPLVELVNKEQIIIDAGNSHPYGTAKRDVLLQKKGIKFLGMGISGGEKGALEGPSLMPGGELKTYKEVEKILKRIAAKKDKVTCCKWMGVGNSGHLVKIVHNGIEYACMQAIAEAYWLLKQGLSLENNELKDIFDDWNKKEFQSYLLEITSRVLSESRKKDVDLIDEIEDKAGAKGTGKWASQIAADIGMPVGTIYSALESRQISNQKDTRINLHDLYSKTKERKLDGLKKYQIIEQAKEALYATILISYHQGFEVLRKASSENLNSKRLLKNAGSEDSLNSDINLRDVSEIWQAGCIIRSELLPIFNEIFKKGHSILESEIIRTKIQKYYLNWKKSIINALKIEIPYQTTSSAINYYQAMKSKNLPLNLTQAQRDLFGAHTFQIKGEKNQYHHNWGDKYSVQY